MFRLGLPGRATETMRRPKYRLLFDWPDFERALREAAGRRRWSEEQIAAALQRDRICSIEVEDIEAHLDWHERLGFVAPKFGGSEA
jgi:hypothetical protein